MTRVTQQHVDARREAILDAAARLFARKGIAGATMADIAAEADLSAGALYRYFTSKEELLRAVFDEAVIRNEELFQQESEEADSPFQALERIGRRVWIDMKDRDALICDIQMALAAARDPDDFGLDLSKNRVVIRNLLEATVREAQASGEIDSDVDPVALATVLQAATAGIQLLKLQEGNQIDVESAFNLFVRMVVSLSADDSSETGR